MCDDKYTLVHVLLLQLTPWWVLCGFIFAPRTLSSLRLVFWGAQKKTSYLFGASILRLRRPRSEYEGLGAGACDQTLSPTRTVQPCWDSVRPALQRYVWPLRVAFTKASSLPNTQPFLQLLAPNTSGSLLYFSFFTSCFSGVCVRAPCTEGAWVSLGVLAAPESLLQQVARPFPAPRILDFIFKSLQYYGRPVTPPAILWASKGLGVHWSRIMCNEAPVFTAVHARACAVPGPGLLGKNDQ